MLTTVCREQLFTLHKSAVHVLANAKRSSLALNHSLLVVVVVAVAVAVAAAVVL
jgi:hypothetical protein